MADWRRAGLIITCRRAKPGRRTTGWVRLCVIAAVATEPSPSPADEGGVSFWLPGNFGSLAALPGEPGWSFAALYYHSFVSGGSNEDFPQGGAIRVGLDGRIDLLAFGPTYTFERPVLGGQMAVSLLGLFGNSEASVNETLSGPGGNTISGAKSQSLTSYGDLLPQATLKWSEGANDAMVYLTGDIPVGDYDPDRLANLGLGHGAIDAGLGYTYFNSQTGREFSAVAGLTNNFEKLQERHRQPYRHRRVAVPVGASARGRGGLLF
jgi:hypothetical protein